MARSGGIFGLLLGFVGCLPDPTLVGGDVAGPLGWALEKIIDAPRPDLGGDGRQFWWLLGDRCCDRSSLGCRGWCQPSALVLHGFVGHLVSSIFGGRQRCWPFRPRAFRAVVAAIDVESASRPLVDFGGLNDNLIKGLILCIKFLSRF
jgi:hypothetical protein